MGGIEVRIKGGIEGVEGKSKDLSKDFLSGFRGFLSSDKTRAGSVINGFLEGFCEGERRIFVV